MPNLIQIKRSLTGATPGSLANGELAYTANGDVLFVGSNGAVVPISGKRFPGTLTANQALVANATSGIDKVIVANLVPTAIYANGSFGTAGQLLTSNGTAVHWNTPAPSVTGSDTQVQFNDGGNLGADAGLVFNKTTDTLTTNTLVVNTVLSTTSVNSAVLSVGTSVVGNSTGVFTTGTVNGATLSVGTSTVANSLGLFATGTVNAATLSVGSSTIGNSTGVFTTGTVNGATLSVGSSVVANSTRLAIGTAVGMLANGTIGTAGQVLHSNGTTVYWATDDEGVTSVASGNGITGGTITSTGTLSILANSGIIANTTGLFVRPGTGVTVNTTGVHIGQAVETTSAVQFGSLNVTGNTALGDAYADIVSINGGVNTNVIPSANITYNLGNTAVRWNQIYSQNVHSVSGYFDGDVQISGNLSVLGTTITISANSLIINDPLLQLAANNTSSDLLDIGFFGSYNPDGGAHEHTGLFRDATDDTYKLFEGLQDSPNNTVNTAGVGYKIATLQAYLTSSGLLTNATHISITANSTVNVAITANTLTLATALAGTSGGTGRSTTTNNALLVGNTTNGYNELALGSSGYVLQSNGTALVYDVLDGGTF